ncbi:MAG: hypothetical protein RL213_1454 [Bacteroidota bacterium]
MPNRLIHESSPYLRQHAGNPVDWYPWSEEAWEKAKREDKLVLISVGYSACHWCHVMERETFEDEASAELMNARFVCIKVDREERPDVDRVYMSAVQLMTGGGGWPLNCFALPDGRPVYGGTYFPNAVWNDLLEKLSAFYREDPQRARKYAEELTVGIVRAENIVGTLAEPAFSISIAEETVRNWSTRFDNVEGGANRAPKFPLPNNYEFLLHYGVVRNDRSVLDHVRLTLDKMAYGGIYDHVGGGFARYSVDSHWKVPHFEKMLYDNAQLVSLYSNAYRWSKSPLYRETAEETLSFIRRELTDPCGLCYAALDADSEGVEGKYYTWTPEELDRVEWPDTEGLDARRLAETYLSLDERGHWEHGRHIPLRSDLPEKTASDFGISTERLNSVIAECKEALLKSRSKRVRPGLDDKLLLSWNSLMISGWCHAYCAFGKSEYLDSAIHAADAIERLMCKQDGSYIHSITPGKSATHDAPVFLEDLSAYGIALTDLYACTFEEKYLERARSVAERIRKDFFDPDSPLYWFTPSDALPLFTRTKEVQDNVLPSSNSSAAKLFFLLGQYYGDDSFRECAEKMLQTVLQDMTRYGAAYSNWGVLLLWLSLPFREVVMTGENITGFRKHMAEDYLPDAAFAGTTNGDSMIPVCRERHVAGKSLIYCCENRTCALPVESTEEALSALHH